MLVFRSQRSLGDAGDGTCRRVSSSLSSTYVLVSYSTLALLPVATQ